MSIERMTTYFEKHGKGHAGETPRIAMDASKKRDVKCSNRRIPPLFPERATTIHGPVR
jgi:hypothetical protein